MKWCTHILFAACVFFAGTIQAQTWPEFHLTNGTHYTSFGVEAYDTTNPEKNLFIDQRATLRAGATELDDIADANQVYLNGGTVYASAIDADDFTWNSGTLYLDGGTHYTTYGLDSGSGKSLHIEEATLHQSALGTLPAGNTLDMFYGNLFAGNLDVSGGGYSFELSTLEVTGTLTGDVGGGSDNRLVLDGTAARWNTTDVYIETYAPLKSIEVKNGAQVGNAGRTTMQGSGTTAYISGTGTEWKTTGDFTVGYFSDEKDARVVVSDGAKIESGSLGIGRNNSNGNEVTVTGNGSAWMTGHLELGPQSLRNKLRVENGGLVVCSSNAVIRGWESGDNRIDVTGLDSRLQIDGSLRVGGYVAIDSGGELIAKGGVTIDPVVSGGLNVLSIGNGGRLTVGTDFDASQQGFFLTSGGTLAVQAQLSGLSLLDTNRRLETADLLGSLTVDGVFAPGNSPADSIVNGGLTIGAAGTLEMELGGYAAGAEHDRLTVTDMALLYGTLDIVLLNDFPVSYGDTFDLFNWDGGVSGTFGSISTKGLSPGLSWDVSALYDTGQISVIPEPGVLSLMAVFGGSMWCLRRYFPTV